jgi:hypothetical protein
MTLRHAKLGSNVPADHPSRYVIVDIDNGYAKGPLRAHLYDAGESSGFRLVGIERPSNHEPP